MAHFSGSTAHREKRDYHVFPARLENLAIRCVGVVILIIASGCGESQQFVAVPSQLNMESVPKILIHLKAQRFTFIPDTITAKAGTLVRLEITAIDGTHGFQLGAFGINESLEEMETKTVEFYVPKEGTYHFRCSHVCGIGHLGMTGVLIVE